jgi:hypothetical protein
VTGKGPARKRSCSKVCSAHAQPELKVISYYIVSTALPLFNFDDPIRIFKLFLAIKGQKWKRSVTKNKSEYNMIPYVDWTMLLVDEGDVLFVLDQHAELDLDSAETCRG